MSEKLASAAAHPFKKMEVCDTFTPERVMIFTRPREDNDTIIIQTRGDASYAFPRADFHLDAGTLKVVAEVLGLPHSTKAVR